MYQIVANYKFEVVKEKITSYITHWNIEDYMVFGSLNMKQLIVCFINDDSLFDN